MTGDGLTSHDSLNRIVGHARAEEIATCLRRAGDLLTTVSTFYDRKADAFSVNDPFLIQAIDAAADFVQKTQDLVSDIAIAEAPLKPAAEEPASPLRKAITTIFEDETPASPVAGPAVPPPDETARLSAAKPAEPASAEPVPQEVTRQASVLDDSPSIKVLRPAFTKPVGKVPQPVETTAAEPGSDSVSAALPHVRVTPQGVALPEPKVPPVPEGPALTYLELLRKLTAAEIFAAEQQALAPPGTHHVLLPLLRDLREEIQRLHSVA